MKEIVIATRNPGKLEEFKVISLEIEGDISAFIGRMAECT